MKLITKLKLALGSVVGLTIAALWFFGGVIGCIVGIVKGQALFAVLSLLIPVFGALYTIVSFFGAIF